MHFAPLDCALTDTGHASVHDVMCSDRACVAFGNALVREMPWNVLPAAALTCMKHDDGLTFHCSHCVPYQHIMCYVSQQP